MNYNFIAGTVSAGGDPQIGSQFFKVSKNGSVYTITFYKPFSSLPVVLVTPDVSNNPDDQYTIGASLHDISTNSFTVSLMDFGGIPQQFPFDFLCIEPA